MMPVGEDLKRKTEEELLASENLTEEERRRIKRRASNRESARRTRHKRTEKLKELEEKKAQVAEENAKIVNQIHELEKIYWDALLENRQLKSDIQVLRAAKPHLSAMCPSSLGSFASSQPLSADFLSMSLPLGTVPPAPPLSLNSDVAGMPNPHEASHLPAFNPSLPGSSVSGSTLPGLGTNIPGSLLSLPPPLSTTMQQQSGIPVSSGPTAMAAPPQAEPPATQGLSHLLNAGLPTNFTSMLEGMSDDGVPAASVQAALAQFYATSGISSVPGMQQEKKEGQMIGEPNQGMMLPPPAAQASGYEAQLPTPSMQHAGIPSHDSEATAPAMLKVEDGTPALPEQATPSGVPQPAPMLPGQGMVP